MLSLFLRHHHSRNDNSCSRSRGHFVFSGARAAGFHPRGGQRRCGGWGREGVTLSCSCCSWCHSAAEKMGASYAYIFRSYSCCGRSVREGIGLSILGVDLSCIGKEYSDWGDGPGTRVHTHLTWSVNRKGRWCSLKGQGVRSSCCGSAGYEPD